MGNSGDFETVDVFRCRFHKSGYQQRKEEIKETHGDKEKRRGERGGELIYAPKAKNYRIARKCRKPQGDCAQFTKFRRRLGRRMGGGAQRRVKTVYGAWVTRSRRMDPN